MLLNNTIHSQYNLPNQYRAFDEQGTSQQLRRIQDDVLEKVSQLASKPQWILLTAECPRPSVGQVMHFHKLGNHMVQMKASLHLSQYQVVKKAIRSGNACAVIANGEFSTSEQNQLQQLAAAHQCEVIFLGKDSYLH